MGIKVSLDVVNEGNESSTTRSTRKILTDSGVEFRVGVYSINRFELSKLLYKLILKAFLVN